MLSEARKARNVINIKQITDEIEEIIRRTDVGPTGDIPTWLRRNLWNWIVGEADWEQVEMDIGLAQSRYPNETWAIDAIERGEKVVSIYLGDPDARVFLETDIPHVIDYFGTIIGQEDISRISVPDAIKKAERWTKSLTKKASKEEDETGLETVKEYGGGFKWVKLSEKCLGREGAVMGHCVGAYTGRVATGETNIYSLRDSKNEPHVTLEYRRNAVAQIQGKQNKPPEEKYHEYVIDFLMAPPTGVAIKEVYPSISKYGLLMTDGKLHEIDKLPAGFKVSGSFEYEGDKELPTGLTVTGNLQINGELKRLPEGLTTNMVILGRGNKITELPDGLTVSDSMNFNTHGLLGVRKIGKNTTIQGRAIENDLISGSHSQLDEIGDGLYVGGKLDLEGNANITKLPKRYTVGGTINLNRTKIGSLNVVRLNVGKNLRIEGTPIKELPEHLTVKRGLFARGSALTKLPGHLKVGYHLDISDTKVKELPSDLTVPGDLDLRGTEIKKLPKYLRVGGALNIIGLDIVEWPVQAKVKRVIGSPEAKEKLIKVEVVEITGNILNESKDERLNEGQTADKLRDELSDLPGFRRLNGKDWEEMGTFFKGRDATAVVFAPGVMRTFIKFAQKNKFPVSEKEAEKAGLSTQKYPADMMLGMLEGAGILVSVKVPARQALDAHITDRERSYFEQNPRKAVKLWQPDDDFVKAYAKLLQGIRFKYEGIDEAYKPEKGQCYKNAYQKQQEADDWILVHGIVWNPKIKDWMGHAWNEKGGMVYDPSHDVLMAKDHYYALGQIQYVKRYNVNQAAKNALKTGTYGPWDRKINAARRRCD